MSCRRELIPRDWLGIVCLFAVLLVIIGVLVGLRWFGYLG